MLPIDLTVASLTIDVSLSPHSASSKASNSTIEIAARAFFASILTDPSTRRGLKAFRAQAASGSSEMRATFTQNEREHLASLVNTKLGAAGSISAADVDAVIAEIATLASNTAGETKTVSFFVTDIMALIHYPQPKPQPQR